MLKPLSKLGEKIYRELYRGCKKFHDTFDVYLDEETGSVNAVVSGVQYPGKKIYEMVTGFSDFVDSDDYTEDEFVECMFVANGEPVI